LPSEAPKRPRRAPVGEGKEEREKRQERRGEERKRREEKEMGP
jgi:hypothetical protein